MFKNTLPIPETEQERISSLAALDIDYSNVDDRFKELAQLAAKIAGTQISLVNLIDSFTQWTIASHGLDVSQMPREESICQYTIRENDHLEIHDLSADERFSDKEYVKGPLQLRYYLGVPLTTSDGQHIGSLCVTDPELKSLSPEKLELLKIVADEVVSRLNALKTIDSLKYKLAEAREVQKKVAHDIRGPIAGIIGLSGMITQLGESNTVDEMLESVEMIHKSSSSVLELADEIFMESQPSQLKADDFNLHIFKEKLETLYLPQAMNKQINFRINVSEKTADVGIAKNKLLQIAGNLIHNALKYTPGNGSVLVDLELKPEATYNLLLIRVRDSGSGMSTDMIDHIIQGQVSSSEGTNGEEGYGFGLALVKRLVRELKGEFKIRSDEGTGTTVEVLLDQTYQ